MTSRKKAIKRCKTSSYPLTRYFSTHADSQTGLANTKIRYLLQAQEGRASWVYVPACGKLTLPVLPEEENAVAKPDLISVCADVQTFT